MSPRRRRSWITQYEEQMRSEAELVAGELVGYRGFEIARITRIVSEIPRLYINKMDHSVSEYIETKEEEMVALLSVGLDHIYEPNRGGWYKSICPQRQFRGLAMYEEEHAAPSFDCTCGFWAYSSLSALLHEQLAWIPRSTMYGDISMVRLQDLDRRLFTVQDSLGFVMAKVAAKGVVVEHEMGWRAEQMRIVELMQSDPVVRRQLSGYVGEER